MKTLMLLVVLILAGCAKDAPPLSVGIKSPPPQLMQDCADIPDIPSNDGDKAERTKYYATSRNQYAACRDNNHGLKRYAETVSKDSKP